MKASVLLKTSFLASALLLSSCATTNYSEDQTRNNFSNLQTGKAYTFTLRDGSPSEKMVFTRIDGSQIIGYKSKKDSTIVSIDKNNVAASKDKTKAKVMTGATVIGAAAAAAIIFSASRAD